MSDFLLLEDGSGYVLTEEGGRIILEESDISFAYDRFRLTSQKNVMPGRIERYFYPLTGIPRKSGNVFPPPEDEEPFMFQGFVQPTSGGDRNLQGKNGESVTAKLFCGMNQLKYNDEIEDSGVKYTVVRVTLPKGIAGMGRHRELLLKEVQ